MSKKQKTCIHTDILPLIDNQVKLIRRIYLLHSFDVKAESKNSTYNMTGWTKLGVTIDQHAIFNNQSLIQETEIWANNKYLEKEPIVQESHSNVEFIGKSYKFINNFTDNFMGFDIDDELDVSDSAIAYFGFLKQYYYDMAGDPEQYGLKIVCDDFETIVKKDNQDKLVYARAYDKKGRIIFAVEKI